jgi:hypothetical protein
MTTTSIIATKEDAEAFCGSCVPLRALWEHYRTLFESSNKRRDLLEATAPIFFRDLNLMFIEQLVQRASDEEWKQFWLDLQDFLNLLIRHHGDSGQFYLNAVGGMSDIADVGDVEEDE